MDTVKQSTRTVVVSVFDVHALDATKQPNETLTPVATVEFAAFDEIDLFPVARREIRLVCWGVCCSSDRVV
jgi:hypothetical protein